MSGIAGFLLLYLGHEFVVGIAATATLKMRVEMNHRSLAVRFPYVLSVRAYFIAIGNASDYPKLARAHYERSR
jgi:hypothetical protein